MDDEITISSRALVGQPHTLSHTFLTNEDTPTSATGNVSVTVKDATGATVASGTATPGGTGVYTFVLAPQAALALLTVTWSATVAGYAVTDTEYCDVAGARFFTIPFIRAADAQLADTAKYPTSVLVAARLETELECEKITGRAFIPRYRRETLDGTGTSDVLLSQVDVRTVRSASVAPRAGQPSVALTPAQLAALAVTSDGMLRRTDLGFWTDGITNVLLEYEYGLAGPPQPLAEAALVRLRSLANKHRTSVPDRASSFTSVDGGTYRLTMPGRYSTGIPDVDAVYARYGRGGGGSGATGGPAAPAGRTLSYDPQWDSMYHGGER